MNDSPPECQQEVNGMNDSPPECQQEVGKAPSVDDVSKIHDRMGKAEAVLWDKKSSVPSLVYVYRDPSGKPGKIVLNVQFQHKDRPIVTPVNMQPGTNSYDFIKTLSDTKKFEIVKGELK